MREQNTLLSVQAEQQRTEADSQTIVMLIINKKSKNKSLVYSKCEETELATHTASVCLFGL